MAVKRIPVDCREIGSSEKRVAGSGKTGDDQTILFTPYVTNEGKRLANLVNV